MISDGRFPTLRMGLSLGIICAASMVLWSCGGDDENSDDGPIPLTVPKAACGPNDKPETALQGQVPAALRASGFKGFSCNLTLMGQSRGDGANWQTTQFKDKSGHVCGYHGTAFTTADRTNLGVPVIDLTDAANPRPTAYLTTTSMLDPWESLKVNERRQVLGAVNGHNGSGGPEVDFYDISGDCRTPQLLFSGPIGDGSDGGLVTPIVGHEGSFAPDGLTYYGGGRTVPNNYYAVDTTNLTRPKLLAAWNVPLVAAGARTHGMSVSEDGTRGYFVSIGSVTANDLQNPAITANNGLVIYDLTDIQQRKPNPVPKVIGEIYWKDGATAQHTIPVKIKGKPYVIAVDEGGSGGTSSAAQEQAACAANLTPFPMARIIDTSDETKPTIASRLMLEVHDPANCSKVLPDLTGLTIFTYGSHYCSVDNKQDATTLACGYFNSGIRVFDIRNPLRPKEIAYYNPAGTTTSSPGSNHLFGNNWVAGGPDWCSAQVHMDATRGILWTTCQDNGVLVLKFTNGAWPFAESSTPADSRTDRQQRWIPAFAARSREYGYRCARAAVFTGASTAFKVGCPSVT